jgi:cytochrome d ubiquinol oxidase subunit II
MAAAVGIGGTVGSIFNELFPRVMISSTNSAYNLTVGNTASPSYTLKVMTVVAVVIFPVVLIYQAWNYHIFKRRLTVPRVGGADTMGGEAEATPSGAAPVET